MADTITRFTAGAIVPALEVWGGYQRFEFNDHFVKLQAYNKFIPFGLNSSVTSIESLNNNLAGFRFRHVTSPTSPNNYGTFSLNRFDNAADTTGTEIFLFDTGNFYLRNPVFMQENLSMGGKKIVSVATPTAGTDAANKDYVDSISPGGTVTLTGNVTGSGPVGTPFATTIVSTLDQIPTPTTNVAMGGFKITGLGTGTAGTDGVNVTQMTSAISAGVSAGTITLTGNVTGSGTVGSSFATTLALRLNQILTPTGAVNMNSQNMINAGNIGIGVASPVNGIEFPGTTANAKICLWRGGGITNDFQIFGFGITTGTLKYTVNSAASNHVFYCGASSTTSTELFRITGTGNVGIGGIVPNVSLQFPDTLDNCKISLYQTAPNKFQVFGFGISSGTLRYSVGSSSNSHTFYCGASSTTSTELFEINGAGYSTVKQGTGTIYCRRPSAHINWSGTLSVASGGSWVKLNCSTVATSGAVQCTTSTNRITYTGSDLGTACVGMVSGSASISLTANAILNVGVYKNGTTLLGSFVTSGETIPALTVCCLTVPNIMVSLSPGDYVELWAQTSSSGNISTHALNLSWFAV